MKLVAAFTMARNQPIFLRLWCNYYCGQLGAENCWVICEPNDPTLDDAKRLWPECHFIDLPSPFETMHTKIDDLELWRRNVVNEWQAKLLTEYSCCIFTDTDEFLIHTGMPLKQFCESFVASDSPYVRSQGWSVVHQHETEPRWVLEPGSDVLENRSLMLRLPRYDKTLLTKVPLRYSPGFHNIGAKNGRRIDAPIDGNFHLLHAWQLDLSLWEERQHLCGDMEQVKQFFKTGLMGWVKWRPYVGGPIRLPEHWRGLLKW